MTGSSAKMSISAKLHTATWRREKRIRKEREGKKEEKKRRGERNGQRLQLRNPLIHLWAIGLSLHRRRHGRCTKKYTPGQPLVERTVSVAPSGGHPEGVRMPSGERSPPQAPLLKLKPPNQTQLDELRRLAKEWAPEDTKQESYARLKLASLTS